MRIHCLGGGLVGSFVTRKLVEDGFDVHLFDVVNRATPAVFHLKDAASADHSSADLIVNMVPGSIGHDVLRVLHEQGHNIVDLSFSETTPDQLPAGPGVVLWDVGIAPGLSNMLVALAQRELGRLDKVSIKVGGNPAQPDDGWSYMAPFSPHDVIAEYTRPARIVRDGAVTVVPAMDELHTIDANGRTMEAFLTDGLRSLINLQADSMGEYTVRWPGHIQRYQHTTLSPDELVDAWAFDPQRPEFTWMEVRVEAGEKTRVWTVEDSGKDGDSSMARTTGLVTFACVKAWSERTLFDRGVHPPEDLPDDVIHDVIEVLKNEGVAVDLRAFDGGEKR
ncbi:MAG: saccharopine dehydrogenase C-terminal domain-containing protein [Candidatus Thermoplasmatota archaeon]|nr:saccharopine dehydrogenase C-terminal domain-containing protein [Candidatus Thermoplasmatota archaeon]MEC8708781.1 saccharopine dehydrogenase C-terminal domain-containing protein [Candidatus Thermoplasmatota archaeon]